MSLIDIDRYDTIGLNLIKDDDLIISITWNMDQVRDCKNI